MLATLICVVLALLLIAVTLHTVLRVVRRFCKFPTPAFMADLIDNPLRRRIQPPAEMPIRHGIEPGMTVLEVGPGNGRYTTETARRIGNTGKLVAVDIQPQMLEHVARRAHVEGITNLAAGVANVYELPFADGAFDAVYMITVIAEIPDPVRAMREFYRVLSPSGTLAFSELLPDPDYPLPRTLVRMASAAGFRLKRRLGTIVAYTLVFDKRSDPLA